MRGVERLIGVTVEYTASHSLYTYAHKIYMYVW